MAAVLGNLAKYEGFLGDAVKMAMDDRPTPDFLITQNSIFSVVNHSEFDTVRVCLSYSWIFGSSRGGLS